jgi:hypothetical protein
MGENGRYDFQIITFHDLKNAEVIADTQAFAIPDPDRRMGRNWDLGV